MSKKDTSDQESDDVHECPVDGCEYTNESKRGTLTHFGHSHDTETKKRTCLFELHRLATVMGRTPSYDDMNERGTFSARTYETLFGGWNAALEEADLDLNNRFGIPNEELLSEIRRLADEHDRVPTKDMMVEYGKFSKGVYLNRFNTWNESLKLAGLDPNLQHNISKEELIDALQQLADTLGRPPTVIHMEESGEYSVGPYQRAFDSWNGALAEAGLAVNNRFGIPDETLLNSLRTLADELGRVPSAKEMNDLGSFSDMVYLDRFGSWNGGVKAAGLEPRSRKIGHSMVKITMPGLRERSPMALVGTRRRKN